MRSGESSKGIFSISFWNELNGIVVGGDYQDPDNRQANAALTTDGGLTWKSVFGSPPLGFRSAVAYVPHTDPPMLIVARREDIDELSRLGFIPVRSDDAGAASKRRPLLFHLRPGARPPGR